MKLIDRFRKQYSSQKATIAFNVQNIYQLRALYIVANTEKVPVIAQFSAKFIHYFEEVIGFTTLVNKYQNEYVTFHLDHCLDKSIIKFCIDKGFASVMFDGSSLPIAENIKQTNEIYDYANDKGCLLEAELGAISGVEDGFGEEHGFYFDPNELESFGRDAKFDLLALAIGNAHGVYQSTEDIKPKMLLDAKNAIGEQLFVLHGGTGMPQSMVKEAISYGVVKINVSTALKLETLSIYQEFTQQNNSFDELKFWKLFNERISSFYLDFISNYTI